jgi:hypothetical protein
MLPELDQNLVGYGNRARHVAHFEDVDIAGRTERHRFTHERYSSSFT